jgi:ribonuclease-3
VTTTSSHRSLIKRLGYQFTDVGLIDLALSHRSIGSPNNERLEFLGDSLVNFIIAQALFEKFPQCREGELSQMRAQLVKGTTLAEIAIEFELGDYLLLGPGELKSGGHRRESILADVVEALIAAIYLDGGMAVCQSHVLQWYQARLQAISPQSSIKDAKSRLQEFLQSRKKALPVYRLAAATGNDHEQEFSIECKIEHLKQCFLGVASNRRMAEQLAAQQALDVLLK